MPTPRRILYPGAIYHATVHSLDELWPWEDDVARARCLVEMNRALRGHGVQCHAYCVMSNHFHLLLRTPEGGLSEAMQQLNTNVARAANRRLRRRGRVLLAPYDARLVEDQSYLVEVARYVVLNPVRAGICTDPSEYRWSSYRMTAGLAPRLPFVTTDWLLAQLGGPTGYRTFVAEGSPAATIEELLLQLATSPPRPARARRRRAAAG
jgi:REP element-mobilizing transposase RayT